MKFIIINGPNLNLLGKREPGKYGNQSFEEFPEKLRSDFPGHRIDYFQSNIEGEIINKLHEAGFTYDGIILNPGGYAHTSVTIADAVEAIEVKVIEVHITNVFAREDYRKVLMIAGNVNGFISGFGLDGYRLAILNFSDGHQ